MKIAIVTGAGSGIGSAFAAALSEPKYGLDEIWLIDLNDAGLRDTAESITIHAKLFCMDIAINKEIESLETELRKIRPNIKMLVNSAGFGLIGWFDKLDMQRQLAMIDVNCKGLTAMTYICIPYMERGGKILHMSSGAALMPQPRFAVYAASKSYVLSFSRAVARILKRKGITMCAICAGPVSTNFYRTALDKSQYEKETRGLRMQTPREVVDRALACAEKGKDTCYPSGFMRFAAVLTKIAPLSWLLSLVMDASMKKYGTD